MFFVAFCESLLLLLRVSFCFVSFQDPPLAFPPPLTPAKRIYPPPPMLPRFSLKNKQRRHRQTCRPTTTREIICEKRKKKNDSWVPVTKTWRLNERHYGALQGYNKDTAWEELDIDQELVMEMRRSYATPPPRMEDDHPYWHGDDRRYAKLTPEQLERSRSESLKDAAERIMPFFNSVVVPSLREGNRCLVVSHANTIRTLIKQIDNISDQDIKQLSIPTGIPLIYRLDRDMRPVDPNCELEFRYLVRPKGYTWATSRQHGFHGVYLGDLERLQDIQKKRDATNRGWQRVILRNIARQSNEEDILEDCTRYHNPRFHREGVVETKHLWWKIAQKMQNPEVRGWEIISMLLFNCRMALFFLCVLLFCQVMLWLYGEGL